MKRISLLINPLAHAAYFNEYEAVARAELALVCPDAEVEFEQLSSLQFLTFSCEGINQGLIDQLSQLSFVYGLFEKQDRALIPLQSHSEFLLHPDFVFGSKFKGKTNETLTQLLINVGLSFLEEKDRSKIKLLDPMCGRATTLLWAMRYGINSKGIEQDKKATSDIRMNIKKWTKVHRQKHKFNEGFVGKANRGDKGKFIEFTANDISARVICGNTTKADELLKKEKFHLIVSDLPYGVQHHTTENTRNPLAIIEEAIPAWKQCLKPEGKVVLAFNNYMPKRGELIRAFEDQGFKLEDFSAKHRMSESIVRDVVVLSLA